MRIAFVISEHADGLLPERVERYASVRRRLAQLADADVTTVHYAKLATVDADATVLSGSADPWSAHDPTALDTLFASLRAREGPVLGICAGMQLLARAGGGEVKTAERPIGPGFATVDVVDGSDLLADLESRVSVWQHHTDEVDPLPQGFRALARSENCAVEAFAANDRPWWGTQFHPEEWNGDHPAGRRILENFLSLSGIPLR